MMKLDMAIMVMMRRTVKKKCNRSGSIRTRVPDRFRKESIGPI